MYFKTLKRCVISIRQTLIIPGFCVRNVKWKNITMGAVDGLSDKFNIIFLYFGGIFCHSWKRAISSSTTTLFNLVQKYLSFLVNSYQWQQSTWDNLFQLYWWLRYAVIFYRSVLITYRELHGWYRYCLPNNKNNTVALTF